MIKDHFLFSLGIYSKHMLTTLNVVETQVQIFFVRMNLNPYFYECTHHKTSQEYNFSSWGYFIRH